MLVRIEIVMSISADPVCPFPMGLRLALGGLGRLRRLKQ